MAITIELAGLADSFPPTKEMYLGAYPIELVGWVTATQVFNVTAAQAPAAAAVTGSLSNITGTNQATATFGQDVNAFGDLDPRLGLLGGQQNLTQAVMHRLSTKRGLLVYAPNDGYDVRQLVNDSANIVSGVGLIQMQQAIESEVEKDERVQSATALVTLDPVGNVLSISLTINTVSGVPLVLVLAVNGVTLQLLQQN